MMRGCCERHVGVRQRPTFGVATDAGRDEVSPSSLGLTAATCATTGINATGGGPCCTGSAN